jgi:hypothetical protein
VGADHELAGMQLANQSFGNLAGGKVEACQVLVGREPGGLDLVGDRADLTFGEFGLEQLRQAWAMPYILSARSMTTTAALAGS